MGDWCARFLASTAAGATKYLSWLLATGTVLREASQMSKPTDIRHDAKRLVEQLPADASWDDLAYEVYVRQAIEQGIADANDDRMLEHDTVIARIRSRIRHAS